MKSFANAGYVTHLGLYWGAGCSKQCLQASGPATSHMVGLSCFSWIPGLPKDYYTLPSGFAYHRKVDRWVLDFDLDEFEPEESDFIAAPDNHRTRQFCPNDAVYTLKLTDGSYAVFRFTEGTRCIPFWLQKQLPEEFHTKLDGSEKLMSVSYSKIEAFTRENDIRFLASTFRRLS